MKAPTPIEIERELGLRGSLMDFVKMAWPYVEPSMTYHHNWHVDAMAEHLEAVYKGEINELLINISPGSTKTLLCSILFPCWCWIRSPGLGFHCLSYDDDLARGSGRQALNLMQSKWFQDCWGDRIIINGDPAVGNFTNTKKGQRISLSLGGGITGKHADIQILDDPHKPGEISKVTLDAAELIWRKTLPSRFKLGVTPKKIVVMQRLHQDDISGIILRDGGFEHLRIPMRFEKENRCVTNLPWQDPRTEEGELMDPEVKPDAYVTKLEGIMGPRDAATQLQQRPSPETGEVFNRSWLKEYYKELPERFDKMIQSWDCAFKGETTSDYVVGQVWGKVGPKCYLVDQFRAKVGFNGTLQAIKGMVVKWPQARSILIEDKANGSAVIETLKNEMSGIIPCDPEGGKLARANAVTFTFEALDVLLPDPKLWPWVAEFVEELCSFPTASHDDQVDACTQALVYLCGTNKSFIAAMKAITSGAFTGFPGQNNGGFYLS